MGAPAEVVARIEAADAPDFDVWAENWDAVNAFLFVCTQWRTVAIGGGMEKAQVYWQGLDYAAVAAGLAGGGITSPPSVWTGLRIMEAAARNALNGVEESD